MRSVSKMLILGIAAFLAVAFGVGTYMVAEVVQEVDDIVLDALVLDMTTFIYATDSQTGEVIEYDKLYDDENRVWVEYDTIPQDMINAFVAIEDERFYSHYGFDVKRLLGAATTYMSEGNSSYGASTITQQLVKNLSGDDDLLLKRKAQEIYRAVRIEQNYSKDEILEFYLNTIFLGRQCNGVQAASRRYFGKNVDELSLAQIASIAGITQYPSKYDPIVNPESNKEKQMLVLGKMKELGMISNERYSNATAEELVFIQEDVAQDLPQTQTYFADAVINEVLEDLQTVKGYPKQVALKMLYAGGLKIYAGVDVELQNIIEEIYSDDSNFPRSYGGDLLQSAMVIIDPYTGFVVGMSGGRGEQDGRMTLNRATQSLRQPGSSIKPLSVYGPALENGVVEPYSIVIDEPITINKWSPKNSGGGFSGAVTVSSAVARSLNIPAVKVLQMLTIDSSFEFLRDKLGFTSLVEEKEIGGKVFSDKNYSVLALGGMTDGVSVLEMAGAYSAYANSGVYKRPSTYVKVLDYEGNVILDGEDEGHEAVSASTAYKITEMLRGVVSGGTGTGAYISGVQIAGKTGTTDEDKDRWFAGYTPYYTGVVWCGYDIPKSMYGISQNPSVAIWKKVMEKVHKELPQRKFEKPDSTEETIKICKVSGKLATSLCALDIRGSQVQNVKAGSMSATPTDKCSAHKQYYLCYSSGLRAHSGCGGSRKVAALGVLEDGEDTRAGYVTQKYCNFHAYVPPEETYIICSESGLLAGENCPAQLQSEVTTKKDEKPEGTCQLPHTSAPQESSSPSPSAETPSGETPEVSPSPSPPAETAEVE